MALRFDLKINQGETYRLSIPLLNSTNGPANVTGLTARGQIRETYHSTTKLYEWLPSLGNLETSTGSVALTVPATVSAAWTWQYGRWDLEVVDQANTVTRLVEGYVFVIPEITR
jgi:hypothetical protein